MSRDDIVPLHGLTCKPYSNVICYPEVDSHKLENRLKELENMGVTAIQFSGSKRIFNKKVLGKGYVGVVVLAHLNSVKAALKIRRVDAGRREMSREAKMLKLANGVHVGPKVLAATENFLLMEFIEGHLLPKWVSNKEAGTVVKVLRSLLEQCWRLDQMGLDHGELSRAPKHVIVDKENRPHIVDFEAASTSRRPSNVSSICQFLFIGSRTARDIEKKLGETAVTKIVKALRTYKKTNLREDFLRVLESCKLLM